jgi:hypothetical protein
MGLLAQLFRHKTASAEGSSTSRETGGREVRDLGAIAAAVGVRPDRGMPGEFELSLGELLPRVPGEFMWPGKHDANRRLRIPAAEVAPGLVRGRAEVSLARLVALAPDVFRWERGESDDPKVRLPIQKLLQQIGSHASAPAPEHELASEDDPMSVAPTGTSETLTGTEIVTAHLPSIVWEKPAVPDVPPTEPEAIPQKAVSEKAEPPAPAAVPVAAAIHPTVPAAPADAVLRTVELRPVKDSPVSNTLRAVILGGTALGSSPDASAAGGWILAPRAAAPQAGTAPERAVPSVLPAVDGGGSAADFAGLQSLFMSSVPLDLAGVAALTAALPGVHACLIRGAAGSAEAGEMPTGLNVEDVRAAAEELARRIGGFESTTIHRGDSAIAIFTRSGVCLSAVTDSAGFVPGVRERLLRVTELLAGAPSTP